MWIIRSFRREHVEYVTKWRSRARCYMGLLCWAVGLNDLYTFTLAIRRLSLVSVVPIAVIFAIAIVPIGYTELAIGQFSKCGYINVWRLSPPFKGIGYTCVYILAVCTINTNLLSTIILHYVRGSMKSPVPWLVCTAMWAKENCYVTGEKNRYFMKCLQRSANSSGYCERLNWETSSDHYWTQTIVSSEWGVSVSLSNSKDLENLLYTAFTIFLVFVMLRKGVSTVELFVPVLCIVPHALQLILFSVALMLPGAHNAIIRFYRPRLVQLSNVTMWNNVMRGAFTGTNLGIGGNVLFGSESADFRTPIHMAALGIYFFNFLLSTLFGLFYCTAISAYDYYDAVSYSLQEADAGTTFLIRDMSIVFLPWPWAPQIWALMYFVSLYLMVVRTKLLALHAFISGIYHMFPKLVHYYDLCAFTVVFVDFWFSLLYYNSKGVVYMVKRSILLNNFCTIIVIFYESMVIMYVYGTANLIDDIHFMLGFRPSAYWKVCWYLCPFVTFMCFCLAGTDMRNVYTQLYNEDRWFFCFGLISLLTCILITPAYMVGYLLRYKKRRKWYKLMMPSAHWGPADKRMRKSREMFTAHSMTKEYLYRQQRQSRQFT